MSGRKSETAPAIRLGGFGNTHVKRFRIPVATGALHRAKRLSATSSRGVRAKKNQCARIDEDDVRSTVSEGVERSSFAAAQNAALRPESVAQRMRREPLAETSSPRFEIESSDRGTVARPNVQIDSQNGAANRIDSAAEQSVDPIHRSCPICHCRANGTPCDENVLGAARSAPSFVIVFSRWTTQGREKSQTPPSRRGKLIVFDNALGAVRAMSTWANSAQRPGRIQGPVCRFHEKIRLRGE